MNLEATNSASLNLQQLQPVAADAGQVKDRLQAAAEPRQGKSDPQELLDQIKSLTEDGQYSVRFEKDRDANELVVKVVDRETNEVIRQIPPEELLDLTKRLNDLRGNLVDTQG
ncbi:MAG: flagellar protein FlaG [Geoalkalibacter sp.]|uniref:flagellar protein FlaG n=1 Tax=Geoalkalibacter sp. TaxID=3041440 RepID=UPI003D0A0AE1